MSKIYVDVANIGGVNIPNDQIIFTGGALSLGVGDVLVSIDNAAGGGTITLPAIASVPAGHTIVIVKMDAGGIADTILANGGTIEGAAGVPISVQYQSAILQKHTLTGGASPTWIVLA